MSPVTQTAWPDAWRLARWSICLALASAGVAAQTSSQPPPDPRFGGIDPAAVTEPGGWGASVAVASEYVVHGLGRSRREPIIKAQVGYTLPQGWVISAGASTMNLNAGPGPSRELGLYLGKRWRVDDDWAVDGSLSRYDFWQNSPVLPYDYTEATLQLSWREALRARLQYSPDYSIFSRRGPAREFATWTGELQGTLPLRAGLECAAGIGYYDLSAGPGRGYYFWSAGIVASRARFSLAISYIGVDSTARSLFSREATDDRVVATLAVRLR